MKKFINLFLILFLIVYIQSFAQLTFPSPFDLSSGNYSLSEWAATNPAGSYPTSMIFHRTSTQDPVLATEMTTNYTGSYSATSGTRINGLGADGFSFVNTSTAGNLGAAVLAINTTNRTNIRVSWTGGFVRITGTTSREYRIRLQFRIGDSGSFQDLTDANGNPIEYIYTEYVNHPNPTILPPHSQTFTATLPVAAEDQPVVYLRWKYYFVFVSGASGARPELRVDNIFVQSESSIGGGTKLSISNLTPALPLTNVPFSFIVNCVDNDGVPKKVSQATTVRISLVSGTGTLLGTLTKVIPFRSTNVLFDDLRYNIAQNVRIRAEVISGEGLSPSELDIQFILGPSRIVIEELYTKGHVGATHPNFIVRAVNSDGSTNTNYLNYIATVQFTGPTNFTLTGTFSNGIAPISGPVFTTAGIYNVVASSPGFSASNTEQVDVRQTPVMREVFIPKFLKGVGNFGTRIPTFALVRLENLHPNTDYRFFTGGRNVGFTGGVETDNGAGNNLHYDYKTMNFWYNSNRNLAQDSAYSTFKSRADGTQFVWMTLVPTTNISFNEGRQVYWILVLGTERGTVIRRYQTSNVTNALDFGTTSTKASGIFDRDSWLPPKTFVCLFDSLNSLHPVTIAVVQDESAILQEGRDAQGNLFPPQGPSYYNNLDGTNGAWATIIPNNLSGGIRRIEVYNLDGTIFRRIYDEDGNWAGVRTANVSAGMDNPIDFKTPNLRLLSPAESSVADFCNTGNNEIVWISRGVDKIDIELSLDNGRTYINLFEGVKADKGSVQWRIPRGVYSDILNRIRILDREHPTTLDNPRRFVSSETGDFYIFDSPMIHFHTRSAIACQGENITLTTNATGSRLKYQWYKDGVRIQGATSQQLTLSRVDFQTSGVYHCEVGGASVCPSVNTDKILVYILTPTKISRKPQDYYGYPGSTAEFKFDVHFYEHVDPNVVSIQWYKNGVALRDDWKYSGTNSNHFTVRNISPSDTLDRFYAIVNGRCGRDTTNTVRIYVVPNINLRPDTLFICDKDNTVEISVEVPSVIGRKKYIVELYRGNILIGTYSPGVAGMRISLPEVSILPGNYNAIVRLTETNSSFKTNEIKVVKITEPPRITKNLPRGISLRKDEDLVLSIEAAGLNLHYQWFKNNEPLRGAVEPILKISKVTTEDAGNYHCIVWNCDTVTSTVCNVSVTQFIISGIEEPEETDFRVEVSPNPVTDNATLSIESAETNNGRIQIYDATGTEIHTITNILFEKGLTRLELNLKSLNLSTGLYYIRTETSITSKSKSFIYIK
ncbi:MAG: T9SS type A sorting domain-containing protein [Ignavibacteria bacterium]|nr:T9SS type A sorting domain-containing protein [Ignavibacteria bacterium]